MTTHINNSTLCNDDNQDLQNEGLSRESDRITLSNEVTHSETTNSRVATNINLEESNSQLSSWSESSTFERVSNNIIQEESGSQLCSLAESLAFERVPNNIIHEESSFQVSSLAESPAYEKVTNNINQEECNSQLSPSAESPAYEREATNINQEESNSQLSPSAKSPAYEREATNINHEESSCQVPSLDESSTYEREDNNINQEESNNQLSSLAVSPTYEREDININQEERNCHLSPLAESPTYERDTNNINQEEINSQLSSLTENSANGTDIERHLYMGPRARTCQCRLSGLAHGLAAPPCYNCSSTDLPPPYRKKERSKFIRRLSKILKTNENENESQPNSRQPSVFTINGNTQDLGYRLEDMTDDIHTNMHSSFSSTRFPYMNRSLENWDLPNNQTRLESDLNARPVAISTSFCLFTNIRYKLLYSIMFSMMLTVSLFGIKQAPFALLFSTVIFTIAVFLPLIRLVEHIIVMKKNCELYQQSVAENQQAFSAQGLNNPALNVEPLSNNELSICDHGSNNPTSNLQPVSENQQVISAQGSDNPAFTESELSFDGREPSTTGSIVAIDNIQGHDDISEGNTDHNSEIDRNEV